MSEEDQHLAISDKVTILTTEDEKIKTIGEILSSDPSRKILKLLFNQALTANQLAEKTGVSLPLIIYHLKKMLESGVIKITKIGQNTKSHDMKFYTIDKFAIVILPTEMSQSAKKSKSLFNSFTRIHRMATLGAVSITAWFSSQFLQKNILHDSELEQKTSMSESSEETSLTAQVPSEDLRMQTPPSTEDLAQPQVSTGEASFDILWSTVIALSVVIAGLVIEIVLKHKKIKN